MKYLFFCFSLFLLVSCDRPTTYKEELPPEIDWSAWQLNKPVADSLLTKGSTYLPVYSEIYQRNKNFTYDLTATVSIRNISLTDSVYLYTADYYDTHGSLIRSYLEDPIYVKPMETIEIVVDQDDKKGGTGANFVFSWAKRRNKLDPFFEAVMISTSGRQGISFTTHGILKTKTNKGNLER